MKMLVTTLLYILLVPVVLFLLLLLYSTVFNYRPKAVEILYTGQPQPINVTDTLSFFNWNIGYAGLGKNMSFFYDGGSKVRDTRKQTLANFEGIKTTITQHLPADFILLQEVDLHSKRSYRINQFEALTSILAGFNGYFAYNYKVGFVPVPPTEPMGKVKGGLATFSRYAPSEVKRYSFPGQYGWPKNLFMLDRCFMVMRFPTTNQKEFIVINTHNEAYDDGSMRKEQMAYLKTFLLDEYQKGNYILVGGDWNQSPPNERGDSIEVVNKHLTRIHISKTFMPDNWQWAANEAVPTNRMVDTPYTDSTDTTTIDFFLASPNLNIEELTNHQLHFEHSDHNPVTLKLSFKP